MAVRVDTTILPNPRAQRNNTLLRCQQHKRNSASDVRDTTNRALAARGGLEHEAEPERPADERGRDRHRARPPTAARAARTRRPTSVSHTRRYASPLAALGEERLERQRRSPRRRPPRPSSPASPRPALAMMLSMNSQIGRKTAPTHCPWAGPQIGGMRNAARLKRGSDGTGSLVAEHDSPADGLAGALRAGAVGAPLDDPVAVHAVAGEADVEDRVVQATGSSSASVAVSLGVSQGCHPRSSRSGSREACCRPAGA